jgi:hypothetical protein
MIIDGMAAFPKTWLSKPGESENDSDRTREEDLFRHPTRDDEFDIDILNHLDLVPAGCSPASKPSRRNPPTGLIPSYSPFPIPIKSNHLIFAFSELQNA